MRKIIGNICMTVGVFYALIILVLYPLIYFVDALPSAINNGEFIELVLNRTIEILSFISWTVFLYIVFFRRRKSSAKFELWCVSVCLLTALLFAMKLRAWSGGMDTIDLLKLLMFISLTWLPILISLALRPDRKWRFSIRGD